MPEHFDLSVGPTMFFSRRWMLCCRKRKERAACLHCTISSRNGSDRLRGNSRARPQTSSSSKNVGHFLELKMPEHFDLSVGPTMFFSRRWMLCCRKRNERAACLHCTISSRNSSDRLRRNSRIRSLTLIPDGRLTEPLRGLFQTHELRNTAHRPGRSGRCRCAWPEGASPRHSRRRQRCFDL